MKSPSSDANRREFLKVAASAAACPYVITSAALGADDRPPASERIVMGSIGIGNQGRGDLGGFLGRKNVQYVAVCDVRKGARDSAKDKVDSKYGNKDCRAYNDFRELLAREDIDAIHCATPDHWHAIIVIEACRNGKDVYCQKPETLTLREGPLMVDAARRYGRVVSGGSQRVLSDARKIIDLRRSGELGTVKSVNVNVGAPSRPCNLPAQPVPPDLDWDLWLGPAPWAPYNGGRVRHINFSETGNSWRCFIDYSGGHMTDWGAHRFGAATFAADVRDLQPVEVVYRDDKEGKFLTYRYPNGMLIHLNKPDTPDLHAEGTLGEEVAPKTAPGYKGHGGIGGDFIECVKTRERPFRDIEIAVNTMVVCHLGITAFRLRRSLKWDPVKQEFPGDEEANRFLDRARREPWVL